MNILTIEGVTRILGKSQGYRGLPIKDVNLEDGTPGMISAWEPTPDEVIAIMGGATVYLHILGEDISGDGRSHPPVKIEVGAAKDAT